MKVPTTRESISIAELTDAKHALDLRVPCEACGAAVSLVDERTIACDYCGNDWIVGGIDGSSLFLPFELGADRASAQIKRWLRQEGHRATAVARVAPVLVPYWRVRRRMLAWHSGGSGESVDRAQDTAFHTLERFERAIGPSKLLADGLPFDDHELVAFPLDRSLVGDGVQLLTMTSEPSSLPELHVFDGAWEADDDAAAGADAGDAEPVDRLPSGYVAGPDGDDGLDEPLTGDAVASFDPLAGSSGDGRSGFEVVRTAEIERSIVCVYLPFYTLRFTFQSRHHTVLACGRSGRVVGLLDGEIRDVHPFAERDALLETAARPFLRAAVCPGCSGSLAVSGIIRGCEACGVLYRHERGTLVPTACEHATGSGELIPFWSFEEAVGPRLSREPSVHADLDSERTLPPRRVWVPAFSPCPPVLARRLARQITENQPRYETRACERLPAAGRAPTRGVAEARAVAGFALDEIDSFLTQATSLSARFAGAVPSLVWLCFEPGGGFLADPVSGVRLSQGVLEAGAERHPGAPPDGDEVTT